MAVPATAERISSRELIDRAAEALGKSLFQLDDPTYQRFTEALDSPPRENPRLRKLLGTEAPWER